MKITQGARAPFRRREHSAVVFGDYMIVHGGLENRQTRSDVFIYNIIQNKWTVAVASNSPALSNHKMIVANYKNKGLSFNR